MKQLHKEFKLEYIQDLTTKLSKSFYERCKVSEYELLRDWVNMITIPCSSTQGPRTFCLRIIN